MHRSIAAAVAACALGLALTATSANAQSWNDARVKALVERATERRAQQLADTGLKDYKALAHGYVTFLAQIGEGLREPPKIVKADELMNQVYWLAPNLSKQHIVGRRDTLLLPTDIGYHRDHLGIVQNNFPAIIRLGDGDEVVDVPHPLSPEGLEQYDFAITDSLTFQLPGRSIQVLEVKVRPRNDRLPRIVGALYLDQDAQVVRMAFNFTRAAFRDPALEDLFVVIENSLVRGRFWLPHRQEIEIQRGGTWLDYPIRGIIRGRWEIADYEVNTGLSRSLFTGPEIVQAPKSVTDTFHFAAARILDSLPSDVRAVSDADVRKVQEEARNLVRAQALRRPQKLTLAVTGLSEFMRFNRVEGFAFGAGTSSRFGGGFGMQARGRYGVDDERGKGALGIDWQSPKWGVRLFGQRDFREAGDVAERSRLINSIAAQEFGSDDTDPFLVKGGGLGFDAKDVFGLNWKLDGSLERQTPLFINATPAFGSFEPVVHALPARVQRVALSIERPTALWWFGTELKANAELRYSNVRADEQLILPGRANVARAAVTAWVERPFDRNRLAIFAMGGGVSGTENRIPQEWLYFGGPLSAPGYFYHEFSATYGGTLRAEWRTPIPAPSFSLGRFGRVPGQATLAFYGQGTFFNQANPLDVTRPSGGYPSVGIATMLFFDVLRIDVARGLRHGQWMFNLDVSRDFWGVL